MDATVAERSEATTEAAQAPAAISLADVRHAYGDVHTLDGITLTVAPGEVVAIVGPSGCGKSTLLDLVCGLIAPGSGRLDAANAVLMPQSDQLLPWLTALDNAALGLRVQGLKPNQARARARPLLEELGLSGFEHTRPAGLSGGMRQRVAFARTVLAGAPVLCLDEPFGALDAITRADAQTWLQSALATTPRTVLLVTHDVEEAVLLADRVVVLSPRPGRILATIDVAEERPRRVTDPRIVALRAQALEAMR